MKFDESTLELPADIFGSDRSWGKAAMAVKETRSNDEGQVVVIQKLINERGHIDEGLVPYDLMNVQNIMHIEDMVLDGNSFPTMYWEHPGIYTERFSDSWRDEDATVSDGYTYGGLDKSQIRFYINTYQGYKLTTNFTNTTDIKALAAIGENNFEGVAQWFSEKQLKSAKAAITRLDDSPEKTTMVEAYEFMAEKHNKLAKEIEQKEVARKLAITQKRNETQMLEKQAAMLKQLDLAIPNIPCPICGNNAHSGNILCDDSQENNGSHSSGYHYNNPNFKQIENNMGQYGSALITATNERGEAVGGITISSRGRVFISAPHESLYDLNGIVPNVWDFQKPFSEITITGQDNNSAPMLAEIPEGSTPIKLGEKAFDDFNFLNKSTKYFAVHDGKTGKYIVYTKNSDNVVFPLLLNGRIISTDENDNKELFQALIKQSVKVKKGREQALQ